jgi:putative phosphoribosyl transferase
MNKYETCSNKVGTPFLRSSPEPRVMARKKFSSTGKALRIIVFIVHVDRRKREDQYSAKQEVLQMESTSPRPALERLVQIPTGLVRLEAMLSIPPDAKGIVLFAHGSGSSRHSPRNRFIAAELRQAGLATLLLDLLTFEEEHIDQQNGQHRFNIGMLARRLVGVTDWLARSPETRRLEIGYFGAGTGGSAALLAATERPDEVNAVVSRGGQLDQVKTPLTKVWIPTLLIVGELDTRILALNQQAFPKLKGVKRLEIVPGATHFFEEPGTLEIVARLARDWFLRYLTPNAPHNLSHLFSKELPIEKHP